MSSPVILPALLALSILVSIAAMMWLIVHARGLVRLFARPQNELETGAARTGQPTRRAVWTAFVLFNLGWIGAVVILTLGIVKANEGPPAGTRVDGIAPRSVPNH